jgi:hypothetical protein
MMDGDVRQPSEIAKENEWIQDNSDAEISQMLDALIGQNADLVSFPADFSSLVFPWNCKRILINGLHMLSR